MKIRRLNKFGLALSLIASLNLIFSLVCYGQALDIMGTLNISECSGITCLRLTTPTSLSLGPVPHFLNNEGERIALIANPAFNRIEIMDSRNEGAFLVTMDITDFVDATAEHLIPKTSIGVMSFNENTDESICMDSTPPDASIICNIEPDQFAPDGNNQAYEEIIADPDSIPDEWISYFPVVAPLPPIIDAPFGLRKNIYRMGLALFIKTPVEPYLSLTEGNYTAIGTFTLTN